MGFWRHWRWVKFLLVLILLTASLVTCGVLINRCLRAYRGHLAAVESARVDRVRNLALHDAGHLVAAWSLTDVDVPDLNRASDSFERSVDFAGGQPGLLKCGLRSQ